MTSLAKPSGSSPPVDHVEVKRSRKTRLKTTCQSCQRTKSKCIKGDSDACLRCLKRNEPCLWDPVVLPSKLDRSVIRKIEDFEKRLELLETKLAQRDSSMAADNTSKQAAESATPRASLPTTIPELQSDGAHETEIAAAALEDLALGGRRQYGALGLNSEEPGVATGLAERPSLPGYFTSIKGLDDAACKPNLYNLLAAIPSQQLSDALIELFFQDISWAYRILHTPTFLQEARQLWLLLASPEAASIDPVRITLFSEPLAAVHIPLTHPAIRHLKPEEVTQLGPRYFELAHQALDASEWAAKPQVRVVQAILLKIAYLRPSDPSAGSSFFVWLSVAIRQCQILGLHRLGSDPAKMPIADAAWPSQPCSLRRELAKRIWWWTLAQDWMFNNGNQLQQISPTSFDTALPANVNEEDLSLSDHLPQYPPTYLTDSSYSNVLFVLAHYQTIASGLRQQTQLNYETIVKLHSGLERELEKVSITVRGSSSKTNQPYLRALLSTVLHNRILRLHRPFFIKGTDPQTSEDGRYTLSVRASTHSAAEVCMGLEELGLAGHTGILWYVPAYGMSAAIVLFVSLLTKEQKGNNVDHELKLIYKLRNFFHLGETAPEPLRIPMASIVACRQACRAIDHFLQSRPQSSESDPRTITDVFKRVTQRLVAPPSRRQSLSESNGSSNFTGHNGPFSEEISASFPSLQLFNHGAIERNNLTFEDGASRQALVSLSTFELNQGYDGLPGFSSMDWSTFVDI